METIICPRCGTENSSDAMNCAQCKINLKFALENQGENERINRIEVKEEMGNLETNNKIMIAPKNLFLWIMAFGALATFPWMVRLGFDIGEFWNLVATAIIGALFSGLLGLVGYFIWNFFGKARAGLKTMGIIAIVIIFFLACVMMLMPI